MILHEIRLSFRRYSIRRLLFILQPHSISLSPCDKTNTNLNALISLVKPLILSKYDMKKMVSSTITS